MIHQLQVLGHNFDYLFEFYWFLVGLGRACLDIIHAFPKVKHNLILFLIVI